MSGNREQPPPPPPLEIVEEGIVWIERGNKHPRREMPVPRWRRGRRWLRIGGAR